MFNNKIFYVITLLIVTRNTHARGDSCQDSCQSSLASIMTSAGLGKGEVVGVICVCCIAVLIIAIHLMSEK